MEHLQNFFYGLYNGVADTVQIPKRHLIKIAKWLYWIVGLLVLVGSCYVLYNRFQKPVAAVLLFMGGWTMLMYYWVKWFKLADVAPEWPPFIAPCPDFLTMYPDNNMVKCVDFVGVAKIGAPNPLKKSSPHDVKATINNEQFYFLAPAKQEGQSMKELNINVCDEVFNKGLVWSGVCEER